MNARASRMPSARSLPGGRRSGIGNWPDPM